MHEVVEKVLVSQDEIIHKCAELEMCIRDSIMTLFHNKAFVVPMSGNHSAYVQAYGKDNPKGKRHLMRLGKIRGMNKESVLFINDAKWINTARIIAVSYTHLDVYKRQK